MSDVPLPSIFVCPSMTELATRMGHGLREGAAVRLVRTPFIVDLHARGKRLQPRQELPEDAFYDGPIGAGSGVFVIAISYPWLQANHPDPEGFHLATLAPLLAAYEEMREMPVVVFLDFMSLFQGERTPNQQKLFSQGLRAINPLYGQQYVMVWCLTRVPPGIERDYFVRGWCTFELTIASALKDELYLLDLGQLCLAPSAVDDFYTQVELVCYAGRQPPLSPDAFSSMLTSKAFTNGKSDHQLVAGLYADFVCEALGTVTALGFGALRWGDAEAAQLAEVLPLCKRLTSLTLDSNAIGNAGIQMLAARLPSSLEELDISQNRFGATGAASLVAQLPASLRILNIDGNSVRCPITHARTCAAVELVRRYFAGEASVVAAEVRAARRAARAAARSGPTEVVVEGQTLASRLRCTGRSIVSDEDFSPTVKKCGLVLTCCRVRGCHWQWLDPYRGEWLLSSDEPLCEGAPHYERRLRDGSTQHLFVYVEQVTHARFWRLGPKPGSSACSVGSHATKARCPTDVGIMWEVDDGIGFSEDPSFLFVAMTAVRSRRWDRKDTDEVHV